MSSNTQSKFDANAQKIRHKALRSITQVWSQSPVDDDFIESEKRYTVESYFRESKFGSAPEQWVENLIRGFEICAVRRCLANLRCQCFPSTCWRLRLVNCSSHTAHLTFNSKKWWRKCVAVIIRRTARRHATVAAKRICVDSLHIRKEAALAQRLTASIDIGQQGLTPMMSLHTTRGVQA